MSKRGRRRNSRRKSSSSSKQSVSPYIFQKQNKSNSVSYRDDMVEKGETDSLGKENLLPTSEDEEKYGSAPPKEKRFKQDYNINYLPNQSGIYSSTREDEENGVKIITSVSIGDMENSSPKIVFQQSHEPLCKKTGGPSIPVTNVMNINCAGSHVQLEFQERNACGLKTTLVFKNKKGEGGERCFNETSESGWSRDAGFPEPASRGQGYKFTFGDKNESKAPCSDPREMRSGPNCCPCCCHRKSITADFLFSQDRRAQEKRERFRKSFSGEKFWDIPPPREFADMGYNTLEDLANELASCRIGSRSQAEMEMFHPSATLTCKEESTFLEAKEGADLEASFDHLSESDHYEATYTRPSLSTNRSSFTKDFVYCQKRKSWIRNNSIAAVEHRTCALPKKRRQTFPGMSEGCPGSTQEELFLPCSESFSSWVRSALPPRTERSGVSNDDDGKQFLPCMTGSEGNPNDVFAVDEQCRQDSLGQQDMDLKQGLENTDTDDCGDKVDQSEVGDSGFDQDIGEVGCKSPEPLETQLSRRVLAIQVTPPSCSGSEEQILQSPPDTLYLNTEAEPEPFGPSPKQRKSSVMTITVGSAEQRFLQTDSRLSMGSCADNHLCASQGDSCTSCVQGTDEAAEAVKPEAVPENSGFSCPPMSPGAPTENLLLGSGNCGALVPVSNPARTSTCPDIHTRKLPVKTEKTRSSLEAKEHLKLAVLKEHDSGGSDVWAKRRKLFKESKQWSSAGGSSITSDITEESVSEDTRSVDVTIGDNEDRGFYTETFHSAAWIYLGDDGVSAAIPPSLNTRARAISIRERTVKISKGTGEYPWGFRIQFSKPILVTEVDTNGAAEEAGLMVGDYVLAVNGTDVTSIPHSEAADLARQGPDILTLTIGSDIARCPNTPRPACRGYLHKRTQSGLIKGWRKRWFVLTHDCCLYYYRHKRDEGKRRALAAVKLEGAEVGPDVSLGKPFVLKCHPLTGGRMYYFCATSNQEMKRWLEAMEKAIHPITQNHVWVDVTRHNSSLPPLAVKNPECLGLLHKMDKNRDMWVQHYCILKDGCLYLYSGIRATHAHGGIYLQGYMVREQPYGSKKSTIELKPPCDEFKTFHLCAENPTENKRWIVAIKTSIKKWLPLHQALQDYMNRPPEETRM